jgi:hypothetical protein
LFLFQAWPFCFFAGYLALSESGCNPGDGGFALCFGSVVYTTSAIIAVPGIIGILTGRHMIREAREVREFNAAMERVKRPEGD